MKKNLLKACAFFFLISNLNYLKAQTVTNSSFENWSLSGTFQHPVVTPAPLFQSSNFETFYQNGILTATKVPGVSGNGLRVETKSDPQGNTLMGIAAWGNVNGGALSGGIPLSGTQPLTGCNVSLRYSFSPLDSGFIAFIPSKLGAPCGPGNGIFPGAYVYYFKGNQSTFTNTTLNFAPALIINPDSCIVIISSSDPINNENGTPGNFIEVDNFSWTGTTEAFPGGNLDVWQDLPAVEYPTGWTTSIEGSGMVPFGKCLDAFKGNYSFMLKNVGDATYVNVGRASLGYYDCPSGPGPCIVRPGMSVPSTPKAFGFYYKYTSPGIDTASTWVELTSSGIGVSGSGTILLPTSVWKFQTVNINNPSVTSDSAFISFESGRWQTAVANSTLLIDDLKFHYCNEVANITGPVSVCNNSSGVQFSINDEFASGFSWSTTAGAVNGSTTGRTISIDNIVSGGTITVIKSYNDGCPAKTFTCNISIASPPLISAGNDTTVCSSDSLVVLTGSIIGVTNGIWSTNGSGYFLDSTDLSTTYVPSSSDINSNSVKLTLKASGTPCSASDFLTVDFDPTPIVNAGPDRDVCVGSQVILGGAGAATYTWNNGVIDNVAFTPTIGSVVYTVTGKTIACSRTDQVTINTHALPVVSLSLADDSVCSSDVAFALAGGSPAGGTYSGTGVSSGNFNPSVAGAGNHIITYTYSDGNNCQSIATQTLKVGACSVAAGIGSPSEMITRIYPNPTTGAVNIEMNNSNKNYELSVTDITGRQIYKIISDKNSIDLNMEEFSKGVYSIRLVYDGFISHKIIMKD